MLFPNHTECANGTKDAQIPVYLVAMASVDAETLLLHSLLSVAELRCRWLRYGIPPFSACDREVNKNPHISEYSFHLKETTSPFFLKKSDGPYFGSVVSAVNGG